ncbi:MAG: ATP-binding cassette domain-containing protein [Clostridiales bacterium]|nr:ATP-binding cassette domain-containing protein [Clostridiales bacterium]
MIEIKNLTKTFEKTKALNDISFSVAKGSVFGLVGSNGAGKSTLLRIMAGVFQPDSGNVYMDGETPFENNSLKGRTAYVSDSPYFFPGATVDSMAKYLKSVYASWDEEEYYYLKSVFPIDTRKKISTMSKGMQRQGAIMLALAYKPDYILFDEIFDGLDPVIRELVKKILIEYVAETNSTVVIASHNLRELEGFCDHIGLLHLGGILLEQEIDGASIGVYRVQFILENPENMNDIKEKLNIVKETHQGKMVQITVKGNEDEINEVIESANPVFKEMLPLTLEELFISEMEVAGYDINKFFQ